LLKIFMSLEIIVYPAILDFNQPYRLLEGVHL
jgi:hypothetical protein